MLTSHMNKAVTIDTVMTMIDIDGDLFLRLGRVLCLSKVMTGK